jgi:chromosome segregation ATPase
MTDETQNLVLEILKRIQADLSEMKDDMRDFKDGQIRVRNEINDLRGDILRLERSNAGIDVRLSRIERRLDLVDA